MSEETNAAGHKMTAAGFSLVQIGLGAVLLYQAGFFGRDAALAVGGLMVIVGVAMVGRLAYEDLSSSPPEVGDFE